MNDRNTSTIFYLACSIAFFIRLWGIWNVSTTDEYNEVIEALRVCSGHFNYERWIKRFYLYILAVQYGLYFATGWIFNIFQNPMDFAEKIIRNMEPLFIIGRFTSVIAGTLTVGLIYKVGEMFYSKKIATIASILLTTTVFHIDLSQQAKVDALLGLLVTVTFYFIFQLATSNFWSKKDFALCGFFMALAVQTKINSMVLIFPFIIAVFFSCEGKKWVIVRFFGIFVIFFFLGFIIANPPVVIAPLHFLSNIFNLKRVFDTPVNVVPNEIIGFFAYPQFYYESMGLIISIVTVLAIINSLIFIDRKKALLLSFILPFFIMMGSLKSLVAPYYLIPMMPVTYILVGEFLVSQYERLKLRIRVEKRLFKLLLILFFAASFYTPVRNVAYHALSLKGSNTRYLAKEWIEANIPAGSKILMDSGKSINSFAPPIAENRESILAIIQRAQENINKGIIVHEMVDKSALVYYELLLKTVPQKSYFITSTMFGLNVEPINNYMESGYEYFVVSGSMKESRTSNYARENMPDVANFYKSLDTDKRVKLIKIIAPTPENRGNTFYIYKVAS